MNAHVRIAHVRIARIVPVAIAPERTTLVTTVLAAEPTARGRTGRRQVAPNPAAHGPIGLVSLPGRQGVTAEIAQNGQAARHQATDRSVTAPSETVHSETVRHAEIGHPVPKWRTLSRIGLEKTSGRHLAQKVVPIDDQPGLVGLQVIVAVLNHQNVEVKSPSCILFLSKLSF